MGINFNFGLGGKGDSDDSKAGTTGATDPTTAVVTAPEAGATPPPTEPIMVTPPVADTDFGDDITINVTDAPLNIEPVVAVGEPQMTEMATEPVMAAPVAATPLNPFADNAAATVAAPVVTENPFATPLEAVAPTPLAVEPVTLEVNEATPLPTPIESAPLNPFADNNAALIEANTSANPFAASEPVVTDSIMEPVAEVAPANIEAAAINPFADVADSAPAVEPIAEAEIEAPVIETENPFADDSVSNDVSTAAVNPFADTTPEIEVPEPVAETTNENPFADMSFENKEETVVEAAVEKPAVAFNFDTPVAEAAPEELAVEAVAVEEAIEAKPASSQKSQSPKGDGSMPLSSLANIKAEIAGFVATHNQNVEDYKAEIKVLEAKINDEKNLLKKRKQEFRNMLGEIEALTEDFTPKPAANDNQPNKSQAENTKPKRKRNRNKKNQNENNGGSEEEKAA